MTFVTLVDPSAGCNIIKLTFTLRGLVCVVKFQWMV